MSKPTLEPMHDLVVIKPEQKATVSSGGLQLTIKAQEEPNRGTVVAVGPGRRLPDGSLIPTTVKVGDRVLYAPGTGGYVKLSEDVEQVILMPETSIIAKIV